MNENKENALHLEMQNRLLILLHNIAVIANESSDIRAALQSGLKEICAYKSWPVGHVYWVSITRSDLLVPSDIWHLDQPDQFLEFRQITENTEFLAGQGLPGRIFESGKSAWINNVARDSNFPRASHAQEIGIKSAFGIPLLIGTEIVGVCEFFSTEEYEPDEHLLAVLENIGSQLGRVVERSRAEKNLRMREDALRSNQKLLETILDNIPAHVFLRSLDGEFLLVNKRYEEIYGIEKKRVIGKTVHDILPVDKAELFAERDREIIVDRKAIVNETRISFEDGERIYSAYKFPIMNSDGDLVSIGGIAFDITERKQAEEKVIASEILYSQVLNSMSDGIFATDKDLRLTLFNNRYIELNNISDLNLKPGEPVESVVRYLAKRGDFGPGDVEELIENRMKIFQSEDELDLETQFSDGRYTQLRKSPLKQGGIVVNVSDVTERRNSEDLIRQSEADYRAIFENAGVGVMDTLQPSREIIRANQWLCDLLGYQSDQLVGKTSFDITHPNDNDLMLEEVEKLTAGEIETYTVEKRFMTSESVPVWCEVAVTSKPIPSARGKSNLIIVNDISQRKLAEENLRKSESDYRAIFENAGVGLLEIIDPSREIIHANQWFCNLLGYNKDQLIGISIDEVSHPEDRNFRPDVAPRLFSGEFEHYTFEKRYLTASGETIWCSVTVSPKKSSQTHGNELIIIVDDITRRKMAEEARDILTDELAHRLKNNMNIVMSLIRFAKRSAEDVSSFEAAVSGQLRALSAAQEWLYKSDWRGVNFDDLCYEILKPFHVEKTERFYVDVPSPLLSPQIAQIVSLMIHELATNATKYGSLSCDGGTVSFKGSIIKPSGRESASHNGLLLNWKEEGGPPVNMPTRSGFGTSILDRIIRDQLHGEFDPQWHKGGLECNIRIRL